MALTVLFPNYTVDAYTGNYCEEKVGCPYDDCAQEFGDNAVCKVTDYYNYFSTEIHQKLLFTNRRKKTYIHGNALLYTNISTLPPCDNNC